jgi:hypothetical protein
LAAFKILGIEKIDCIVLDGDEVDGRLVEIAENLHRAELTAQERAEQIAEWVRLMETRVSAQVAPNSRMSPMVMGRISAPVARRGVRVALGHDPEIERSRRGVMPRARVRSWRSRTMI